MKKYFLPIGFLLLLFSAPLMADNIGATQIDAKDLEIGEVEAYPFVGLTGSYNNTLLSEGVFGIRGGMQNNVWRTIFTYESNFDEYQSFILEVDRTVVAGLFGDRGRIYLGASGGWAKDDSDPYDTDGYIYGGNIGFMYYLSDRLDMDIGYRYMYFNKDDIPTQGPEAEPYQDINEEDRLDHLQGPTVSLHYFF